MGICPKCNSSVEPDAKVCSKCGSEMAPATDMTATLNVSDHIPMEDGHSTDEHATELQATLDSVDIPARSEDDKPKSGTLVLPDSSETSATLDDPESLRKIDESSDDRATVVLPQPSNFDLRTPKKGTVEYTETELKEVMKGIGSHASTGVSSGQLKKVWEAAIGTSGKDSKQSLRHDRAEASDSVFRRVATRVVADANTTGVEGADYQIKDKLGEGGMGIVYSAIQTTVNRIVAIKSIRKDKQQSDRTRNQFFYEAEITADLDHPNIPPIYDLGTTKDGLLFYSMKLIDGVEWQKQLSKNTREENLEIFKKVSDAVAFAHSKGVIHRDLKPDNVMLGKYGEVYLTDWGLAFNMNRKKPVDFGGTPDYMSPEMARNRQSKIGKGSDVYLLGAVLFQALTGSPPHVGRKILERLAAAERNEIAPANTDDTLLEIAYKAMATEVSDRYASVEEMQEAIRQIRQHEESITLTHRAEEAAGLAIASKDYDRFTRAIFGFRDAIELWEGNTSAKVGLQRTRLAYGQCAFDKGDNDLVLQTLDRSVDAESRLYDKAVKAKAAVEQREQRFKTLWRTFAAAVLLFLCVATGLAGFATLKWRGEAKQTEIANSETVKAKAALEQETLAKIAEEKAKGEAIAQRDVAEMAKKEEEKAKGEAIAQRDVAEMAKKEEEKAKGEALAQRDVAEMAKMEEEKAKGVAIVAKLEAEQRAAQIQLGDYQSKLGLAKAQVEQFKIRDASKYLGELKEIAAKEFGDFVPRFDSWGWQRVNMLTNADLPRQAMGGKVSAIDFASGKNVGIAGTENGKIHLIRYQEGKLAIESSFEYPNGKVETVAISPNGDEAVFCVAEQDKSQVYVWSLQPGAKPLPLQSSENRAFQAFAYSPNADRLIGGVNGGVWIWSRSPNWIEQAFPKEVPKVQSVHGRLSSLEWIDMNRVLATSILSGRPTLYQLELQGNANASRVIGLPIAIRDKLTAVQFLQGNRMLFGLSDGSMLTGEWNLNPVPTGKSTESPISKLVELPTKHRTAVTNFLANPKGEILSMSDEPVAHVWLADSAGAVTYDSYLTGAPGIRSGTNLSHASFVSDEVIVGVDGEGMAVAWNVLRQKQRRQLSRQSSNGQAEYVSPVVGVFNRGQSQQALAITDDGVVDLWNLQDGKTTNINNTRWTYFGHTPGAEFVDSAVDVASGLVVTSANLKNADRRYLDDPSHNWEFCVWDQKSGNMVRRWSEKSEERVELRLSILEPGKQLLISSDSATRIVDFAGQSVFQSEDVGTYFAITNPKNPSLTAMIKRSGYAWLWDRNDSSRSIANRPELFVSDDENEDGTPLKGIWSPSGERLYVVYSNGAIYGYEKNGYKQNRGWPRKKLWQAPNGTLYRARNHYDLDVAIATRSDESEILYVTVRISGSQPETRLTALKWDPTTKKSSLVESESKSKSGIYWLDEASGDTPLLSDQLNRQFKINERSRDSILSKVTVGKHTFVSTKSGKVYDLTDNASEWVSLGRNRLLSATSDLEGKIVWTLHNDGSLWKLEVSEDNRGEWKRADWKAQDCSEIRVSPDGQQLAMLSDMNGLKIVESATGKTVGEYAGVAAMLWDSMNMLIAYSDGRMERIRPDGKDALGRIELAGETKIKSLNLFNESWSDSKIATNRYALVQTENANEGQLNFVPLNFVPVNGAVGSLPKPQSVGRGLRIATSPTDSVFVTGNDSGTVSVWFASPKWDKMGVLFDLEGHLGAAIETATFSNDGNTLVTSDSSNRLFGWLSHDVLTSPKVIDQK